MDKHRESLDESGLCSEAVENGVQKDDLKEQIIDAIGGFGKWQLRKCLFILLIIWTPASFHLLNMIFFRFDNQGLVPISLTAKTDHWCAPPSGLDFPDDVWKSIAIPQHMSNDSKGCEKSEKLQYDKCHLYDVDFKQMKEKYGNAVEKIKGDTDYISVISNQKNSTCKSWAHDTSEWKRTIIHEWDLVCDREPLLKLTQQVTFFGLLCGAFMSGLLSDRFGRLPTMLGLVVLVSLFGTISAFSPNYVTFLICIWVCGFSSIGFGTVMYCWMMEILAGREKTFFGVAPHLNYAIWGLGTAAIAYLLPVWWHMQLVFSLPLLSLLIIYWYLPESPRWLLANGHTEKAEQILHEIANYNGKPLPANFQLKSRKTKDTGHVMLNFIALFKYPNLRMKTLIVFYMWFATSFVYYGLTLNSNNYGASLLTTYSIGKAMEVPAFCITVTLLLNCGRRLSCMILFTTTGVALIATIFIQPCTFAYEWPIVTLNILGRASSIGTLALCYVYSAEVFPTVVRNVGIGSSSVWARVGPILVPYVAENAYLKEIEPRFPMVILGIVALLGGFLVSFLPETTSHKLPDTIAEGELLGKGDTFYTAMCKKKKYDVNVQPT